MVKVTDRYAALGAAIWGCCAAAEAFVNQPVSGSVPKANFLQLLRRKRKLGAQALGALEKESWTVLNDEHISIPARSVAQDRPYASVIEALRAYHSIHGDLVIPRRFVVPSTDDYPTEWHGVSLASTVYNMRWWQLHVRSHPDRVAELNALSFVWERLQPEWNLVLEALVTYSSLNNGSARVPASFVVPYDDETYPKATWGINLGSCVFRIRARGDFLNGPSAMSRRAQLEGLGFVWDPHEHAFMQVYRALKHFRKIQIQRSGGKSGYTSRALRVPSTFVVPSNDEWPEDLWGIQLGAKCSAMRHKELYVKNNPDRRKALEELGFQWSGNATLGWLEVIHASAIYSRLHGRTLDVPSKFIVPGPTYSSSEVSLNGGDSAYSNEDEWPWPESLQGLPLGQRLKDIRLRGAYLKGESASSRRAQLDALGFNWTPKRGRRKTKVA